MTFKASTAEAGLALLERPRRAWLEFFDDDRLRLARVLTPRPGSAYASQPGVAKKHPFDRAPYYGDAIFGDFDNDGWADVVVLDRSEAIHAVKRAMLFINRGNGTFQPMPTTFSGLDATGISGEAADLNNDGLLDLVFAADPDNSGLPRSLDRYEDKVYWNTGAHGGKENHWLRLRFSGVRDAELIGACVTVHEPGTGGLLGTRSIHNDHSYKSGSPLEAHFGLGNHDRADIHAILPNGTRVAFPAQMADRFIDLNLATRAVLTVAARPAGS